MATIYRTLTFTTGSVAAGASTSRSDAIVGNVADIIKIKVAPSNTGITELTKVELFTNSDFASGHLVYATNNFIGNLIDPIWNDGSTTAEKNEGFVCKYQDLDALSQLNSKITNNGTLSRTFTVTITYTATDNRYVNAKNDFGATGDGTTDDTTALQNALNSNKSVFLPAGTYKITTALTMKVAGQILCGSGTTLSILNYAGSGFALLVNDLSNCTIRDLELITADEGIDFKITSGNCTLNLVENIVLTGPGRGATSITSTRRGIIFRRMISSQAVFFNTIRDCFITQFDRAVFFDAANSGATTGGNANTCSNIHIEHCWFGYYIRSIENTIVGGIFNSTGGNSSSDYFVGYKVTNSALYNNIKPAMGEPGTNSMVYEFDAGTIANAIENLPFNYDLGGTDSGDYNTASKVIQTYNRTYTGLAENHYYSIPVSAAISTNYTSMALDVFWAAKNSAIVAAASGTASIGIYRDTAISSSILSNSYRSSGPAVRFVGTYIASSIVKLIFYVGNNGTSNTSSSLTVVVTGIENGITMTLSGTASDEGTSDPSTASIAQTYTPSLTNSANIASSTAYACQYFRVGNMVSVAGRVDITPTAAASTLTTLRMTLPITSAFTTNQQLAGTANDVNSPDPAGIYSDTNKARFEWRAQNNSAHSFWFTFMYQVL